MPASRAIAHKRPSLQPGLRIGEAAAQSGVSAKMIRYYESIGVIGAAHRTDGNYRAYEPDDVLTLRFIARGRNLGFSTAEITALLQLWRQPLRRSAEVKALALRHVAALDQKIAALQGMRATLTTLADKCHGDTRSACAILDGLAGTPRPARVAARAN